MRLKLDFEHLAWISAETDSNLDELLFEVLAPHKFSNDPESFDLKINLGNQPFKIPKQIDSDE